MTLSPQRLRTWLLLLIVPVGAPALWWFASRDSTSVFFPPLSEILSALYHTWLRERLVSDVAPSLARMFAGYGLAAAAGIGLGLLLGRVTTLRYALDPVVQFVRAIPSTAMIPIAILLLGIGDSMKIILIAVVCVFPILLNTIDGVRGVEATLNDVARSYRLTPWQRAAYLLLPSAALPIFAGLRIAMSVAFIVMIISEMIGATNGIGYATLAAQRNFRIPEMWAGMILMGVLGYLLNNGFLAIEKRLLHAHLGARASQTEAGVA
ncbi:ABC transporter permease [Phytohabitans kaempferiae]|uniref:ABC transporter permease n=1 Tax=Phytohabitans kaempferiae TaxID=1620943 RepID=A0ABV6LYW8_9ACTN